MPQSPHKCLENVITFRASSDLVKTLTDRAKERGISRSDLIRECAQQPADYRKDQPAVLGNCHGGAVASRHPEEVPTPVVTLPRNALSCPSR